MSDNNSEDLERMCADFLHDLITSSDETLFLVGHREERIRVLQELEILPQLIGKDYSPVPDIAKIADKFDSFRKNPLRWSIMLLELETIYQRLSDVAGEKRENGEEEVEDNGEPAEANDADQDEDEEEIGQEKLERLIHVLKKDFSYADVIIIKIVRFVESYSLTKTAWRYMTLAKNMFEASLEKVKRSIKIIGEIIGIKGILVGIGRIMDRNRIVNSAIKLMGTIVLIPLFLAIVVVLPIYVITRNPARIIKWLAKSLDLEIPEGLGEE